MSQVLEVVSSAGEILDYLPYSLFGEPSPTHSDPTLDPVNNGFGESWRISGNGDWIVYGCGLLWDSGGFYNIGGFAVMGLDRNTDLWSHRVPELVPGFKEQQQSKFEGEGWSIDISDDGNKVVVGAYLWSKVLQNGDQTGRVYTYEWDNVSNYVLVSSATLEINNPDLTENWPRFGHSLALSGDGLVLAVAPDDYQRSGSSPSVTGLIQIFTWNGGTDSWDFSEELSAETLSITGWATSFGNITLNYDGTILFFNESGTSGSWNWQKYTDTGTGFINGTKETVQFVLDGATNGVYKQFFPSPDGTWGLLFTGGFSASSEKYLRYMIHTGAATFVEDGSFDGAAWGTISNNFPYIASAGGTDISTDESFVFYYPSYISSTILQTCYLKAPEIGIVDTVCVEYAEPPNTSLPTPPLTPSPPLPGVDSPPEPLPTCADIFASYLAAAGLSANDDYADLLTDTVFTGVLQEDGNGNILCY